MIYDKFNWFLFIFYIGSIILFFLFIDYFYNDSIDI